MTDKEKLPRPPIPMQLTPKLIDDAPVPGFTKIN